MSIKKHIPNIITSMNLFSGIIGVILTIKGHFDLAFISMILALIFDFFDGLSARLLKVSNNIGKELDSLADVVSFGVLPSLMLYAFYYKVLFYNNNQVEILRQYVIYTPLIIALFSAVRLAKFNLDERQHSSFLGLPTPANAMLCASFVVYCMHSNSSSLLIELASTYWFIPLFSLLLSFLLVSDLPMFGMKFGTNHSSSKAENLKRISFLLIIGFFIILSLVFHRHWSLIILLSFTMYIVMNIIFWIVKK